MSTSTPGIRRYFYEHLFHTALDAARDASGELIPISRGRAIRRSLDEHLLAAGTSMDEPALAVQPFMQALQAGIAEHTNSDPQIFPTRTTKDEVYARSMSRFSALMGIGQDTSPQAVRVPISPYDPRWAVRGTVRENGNEILLVRGEDLATHANNSLEQLHRSRGPLDLIRRDENVNESVAGRARSLDDITGISVLMDKMSRDEYRESKEWLVAGMRKPDGRLDFDKASSPAALERCTSVLDYLRAEGLDYSVEPDRKPGQIKAKIAGSGMEVRLIDLVDESYAGARVYDNGLVTRYSTNLQDGKKMATYVPSAQEVPRLLDFARGKDTRLSDEPGLVGSPNLQWSDWDKQSKAPMMVPYSYHETRNLMVVVADHPVMATSNRPRADLDYKVMLRSESGSKSDTRYFVDAERADDFLEEAVTTARANLEVALDVETLIEHQERQLDAGVSQEELIAPQYSPDLEVAAIQRSYWDVLTGDKNWLLRPGVTEEMYLERLEAIGEDGQGVLDLGNLAYAGDSPQAAVREHAGDVGYELIGTTEAMTHEVDGEWVDKRFHPTRVARWMTSSKGQWGNQDDLAAALRRSEIEPAEMLGEGFQVDRFKDRMLRFDPQSAQDLLTHPSPFLAGVGATLRTSIETNAARFVSASIDDNGVISYEAEKVSRKGAGTPVRGQLGQVFDPGEHGEIVTKFASGENALVVPGYQARILPQDSVSTPLSVEARTRLRGYEQLVNERIQGQIRSDLITQRSEVGEPAALNSVYSQLTGTKHPADFIERAMEYDDAAPANERMCLNPWVEAIVATEAARVRYDNEIQQGSTIYAEHRAEHSQSDPVDDNHFDAWTLTGGRNMAVLTGTGTDGIEATPGYFDPVMTGGATNQGVVRYLTQDAAVAADGTIIPGDPSTTTGSRTALMNQSELASMAYDPFDRQQMTASTIMQSSKVTEPVGTALMTFGGWTADDPIVVSTEFAEQHQIRGTGGHLRDLVVGDKLSDLHGNKGVISLIVDREMDAAEAAEAGIEQEVAWFNSNPDMNVVLSPFSLISRRNAGAARELMSGPLTSLGAPEVSGQERLQAAIRGDGPESLGSPFADAAAMARAALQERYAQAFSDQSAGALASFARSATDLYAAVGSEGFSASMMQRGINTGIPFSKAASDPEVNPATIRATIDAAYAQAATLGSSTADGIGQMRFVVTHMAVDEKTKVYDEAQIRAGRGRKASSQLAWALQSQGCSAIMREFYGHNSGAEANLREYLQVVGMDMESDGMLRVVGEHESLDEQSERRLIEQPPLMRNVKGFVMVQNMVNNFGSLIGDRGGDLEIPFPLKYRTGKETEAASDSTYKMPVLSSHLRSGQEFQDGGVVTHDYTRAYSRIFEASVKYRAGVETLANKDSSPKAQVEARKIIANEPGEAQRAFDGMTAKITSRVFEGKNNAFKTGLMSSRLSDSATMVWTSDPRLDIDQVALSSTKAQQLGLAEGDHALVWRDPVLRDAGVRYMRVAIDDRLTGAAINPVMDKCFDGDFDGDSVAVVKLHSPSAKAEAMRALSVPANMLDTGVVNEQGEYPLALQISLDTQVAIAGNPELADEFSSITAEINAIEATWREFDEAHQEKLELVEATLADEVTTTEKTGDLVDRHSQLLEQGREFAGEINARRSDMVAQLSDAYRSAQRTEFGSALTFGDRDSHLSSVREVCVETGAKGNAMKLADYARNLGDEAGNTGITKEDQEASMFAAAMKAHATGLGGSFSQRAVRALRGPQMKAVLEVTYPVTQSILQAKHDAAEARHKYEMLQGPGRELWRGRVLEYSGAGRWTVPKQDGEPIQAGTQEWKKQFIDFYTSKEGFGVDVNPDYVDQVADALTDPKTGLIRNLEEDKALSGSLLDTMAYGGELDDLIEAAKQRRSIFEGEYDSQFAASGTRAAIASTQAQLADIEGSWDAPEHDSAAIVSKPDVLAESHSNARTRGAARRSTAAVAVSDPRVTEIETVNQRSTRAYRPIEDYISNTSSAQPTKDEGMAL